MDTRRRCEECNTTILVHPDPFRESIIRSWLNISQLEQLVRAGCDFCMFVLAVIKAEVPTFNMPYSTIFVVFTNPTLTALQPDFSTIYGHFYLSIPEARFATELRFKVNHIDRGASWSGGCSLLQRAKIHIDDCTQLHHWPCLKWVSTGKQLPRRLLDLSHGSKIVLIDVPHWISTHAATKLRLRKYCALSYRWAKSSHQCMLRQPFSCSVDFELSSMPQVFQDAITVARHMNIWFLWIDALCIIQPSACGNTQDWYAEGPRVGVIYENAFCTISATCSDSPDHGFLQLTGVDEVAPRATAVSVTFSEKGMTRKLQIPEREEISYRDCIDNSMLNKRGWVLQERFFSLRILHFTRKGILWECPQETGHSWCKDSSLISPMVELRSRISGTNLRRIRVTRSWWIEFIISYSLAEFTHKTDRLVALSSMARRLHEIFPKDQYYAGIWRHNIIRFMLWYCLNQQPTSSRDKYLHIAPSWSWASVDGAVSYWSTEDDQPSDDLAEFVGIEVLLTKPDNPYGNVRQGALRLIGQYARVTLPVNNAYKERKNEPERFLGVHWDTYLEETHGHGTHVILPVRRVHWNEDQPLYHMLVLEEVHEPPVDDGLELNLPVFRRVGYVRYEICVSEIEHRKRTWRRYCLRGTDAREQKKWRYDEFWNDWSRWVGHGREEFPREMMTLTII